MSRPSRMLMSAEANGGDVPMPPDPPDSAGAQGRDWQSGALRVHVHTPAWDLPPPRAVPLYDSLADTPL